MWVSSKPAVASVKICRDWDCLLLLLGETGQGERNVLEGVRCRTEYSTNGSLMQGQFPEARQLFEKSLAIREGALGVDHPDTIESRAWIASLCQNQGFLDKASSLLEDIVSACKRVHGRYHRKTASALNNLAELLRAQVRAVRILQEDSCGSQ